MGAQCTNGMQEKGLAAQGAAGKARFAGKFGIREIGEWNWLAVLDAVPTAL